MPRQDLQTVPQGEHIVFSQLSQVTLCLTQSVFPHNFSLSQHLNSLSAEQMSQMYFLQTAHMVMCSRQ